MNAPDWKEALPAPPPGARLHEAWMTSFEPPDASLLVEHLLPSLLGSSHHLSQEPMERRLFFGELVTTLENLRGQFTIISSPQREPLGDPVYPWLWRYVNHFTVGADAHAVQHAKLWVFHWKTDGGECLELHISSTNLTASAFKTQIQAGWQVSLNLNKRSSLRIRRTWGNLILFLEALGRSAGTAASAPINRLLALLGRAECPSGVTFIASIPGRTSAARQLKQFKVSEIHVLTPTIGEWNGRTLSAWSSDVGIAPKDIRLKWISERHPWASTAGWALSMTARNALEASGVRLESISSEAKFTEQHRDGDPRWSHAKLYLIKSRGKHRLLLTSANWSSSAWGAGKMPPRNFELGVIFQSEWLALKSIGEPFNPPRTIPFCRKALDDGSRAYMLEWGEASWDGKRIQLSVRSSDRSTPITALVIFADCPEKDLKIHDGNGIIPWMDSEHPPLIVRLMQSTEMLEVKVIDLRSLAEFARTPLPEVDPAIAAELREVFLLQRYGGPAIDVDSIIDNGDRCGTGNTSLAADYSVQVWVDARAAFSVVDRWRSALEGARSDPLLLERVRFDGKELYALYARRKGVDADLAAEELGWRNDEEA